MKTDFIETLYAGAEYYDTVKNSILYVMKTRGGISEHDLQDCINEVFLIAMNKRRILEGHPSIKGWLSVTAQNVAKRYARSRAIETKLFIDEEIPETADGDGEFQRFYIEFLDLLKSNLRRSEYTLFTMRFIEERTVAEIADAFEKSPHAIEARLVRLKKKIRKILSET